MLFTTDITIPANTAKADASETILKIAHGIITWVSVFFPAGCIRLARATINYHEHQTYPSTEGMYLAGDNGPIEWAEYYEAYSSPYQLKIKAWNIDDTYDHTITVRIAVLPRKVAAPLTVPEVAKNFLGLLYGRAIPKTKAKSGAEAK